MNTKALYDLLELPGIYARELADARAAGVPDNSKSMQKFLVDYELLKSEIARIEVQAKAVVQLYRI